MFLDRECHSLLEEEPIQTRIGSTRHFFSRRNPDEFLGWLDDLRASAGEEHFQLVEDLYGPPV